MPAADYQWTEEMLALGAVHVLVCSGATRVSPATGVVSTRPLMSDKGHGLHG